jgi:hypothetical protein
MRRVQFLPSEFFGQDQNDVSNCIRKGDGHFDGLMVSPIKSLEGTVTLPGSNETLRQVYNGKFGGEYIAVCLSRNDENLQISWIDRSESSVLIIPRFV